MSWRKWVRSSSWLRTWLCLPTLPSDRALFLSLSRSLSHPFLCHYDIGFMLGWNSFPCRVRNRVQATSTAQLTKCKVLVPTQLVCSLAPKPLSIFVLESDWSPPISVRKRPLVFGKLLNSSWASFSLHITWRKSSTLWSCYEDWMV